VPSVFSVRDNDDAIICTSLRRLHRRSRAHAMTLGELRDTLCNTNRISHKSTTTHPQNLCALRVLCARQRRCYHLHALLRRLHRRSRAHAMTLGELRDTLCNTNRISHKSTTTHPQNLCALRVLCARQRRCYHLHALLRRLHRRSRAHAMTLGGVVQQHTHIWYTPHTQRTTAT